MICDNDSTKPGLSSPSTVKTRDTVIILTPSNHGQSSCPRTQRSPCGASASARPAHPGDAQGRAVMMPSLMSEGKTEGGYTRPVRGYSQGVGLAAGVAKVIPGSAGLDQQTGLWYYRCSATKTFWFVCEG